MPDPACNKWRPSPSCSIDDFDRDMLGTCGPELIYNVLNVSEEEAEALLPMFDFLSHRVGIGFSAVVVAVAQALHMTPRPDRDGQARGFESFLYSHGPVRRCHLKGCSFCKKG